MMNERFNLSEPVAAGEPLAFAASHIGQPDKPIRLLLVTDVRLMRDGLVQILSERNTIKVVGAAATAAESFDAVKELSPSLAIVDMSCREVVEMVRALRAASPAISIVGFATRANDAELVDAVEAGIAAFVPRDGSVQALINAIESAARGEVVCSPQVVASVFRRLASLSAAQRVELPSVQLSARELQVTELIDRGLSNKAIAHLLQIGVATVKNHVHNILEKLQVDRRGEAAAYVRDSMVRRSTAAFQRDIGSGTRPAGASSRDVEDQALSPTHSNPLGKSA